MSTAWDLQREFHVEEIANCMRCGFCLPTCPTYIQIGKETASPRGRIALMKAALDGKLALAQIEEQMSLCLGCRNCESVCPAGVKFGTLLEDARAAIVRRRPSRPLLRRLFFDWVFPRGGALKLLGTLLWFYQASGLQGLAHRTGLAARLAGRDLAALDRALPRVPAPWRRRRPAVLPARGARRLRVGLFTGCVMDQVFFATNANTIRVLQAAGCEVVVVPGQGCCGALHAHAGEPDGARALARRNIQAFLAAGVEAVVNNAGGCGAALKEYPDWFRGDPQWAEKARSFAARVRDFSELLATLPLPPLRPLPGRVTVQDSCHLAHGQGIREQPRQLLRAIPGLEVRELREPDRCCGSAGIYNLTQPELSMGILDGKMAQVQETGAATIVTANPGCLLQMRLGIQRAGLAGQVRAVHIADLLAAALPPEFTPDGEADRL